MDLSPNPYVPPPFDPKQFQDQPAYSGGATSDYSWVQQVRTFAILNAVQGVLEIPVGLMTAGIGAIFPMIAQLEEARPKGNAEEEMPTEFFWFIAVVYFVLGLPVIISGVLRLIAAWKNYRFRGRVWGMVSIITGMSTMLSCYCAPTAVGLLVYGLILYMNPAVKAAFQMAEQGHSVDQVLATFNPYATTVYPAPPADPGTGPQAGEKPFA